MMDLMTGKMRCKSGWITVDHVTYTQKKAGNYLDEGIAVIPADGVNRLLFLEMSYMENLTFLLDRKLKKSLIPGKIYPLGVPSDRRSCDRCSLRPGYPAGRPVRAALP